METLNCSVYKSPRKDEMYLYVPEDKGLSDLPPVLLEHFGPPVFVMTLSLSAERPLARADVREVMAQLQERGYFLQLPPQPHHQAHTGN